MSDVEQKLPRVAPLPDIAPATVPRQNQVAQADKVGEVDRSGRVNETVRPKREPDRSNASKNKQAVQNRQAAQKRQAAQNRRAAQSRQAARNRKVLQNRQETKNQQVVQSTSSGVKPLVSGAQPNQGGETSDRVPTVVQIATDSRSSDKVLRQRMRLRRIGFAFWFLLMVVAPTSVVGYYFFAVASPQYVVETQFAVRGSDQSPLSTLGLPALPGVSSQDGDSYVVQNYLRSTQVIRDILEDQGLDIRVLYSREFIDLIYRNDADVPFIKFEKYWGFMSNAEFNSITGNTTFRVFAFTPEDAATIADAVLKQSSELVNELSAESRRQLIGTAREEVDRTEARLRETRVELQEFQNETQTLDPNAIAAADLALAAELNSQLAQLRARRVALRTSVREDAPSVRVLDRQIDATEEQLASLRSNIGTGTEEFSGGNLVDEASRFVELTLNVEFATEAYKSALASLETALTDARKQQRYLATFIQPEAPLASDYPNAYLNTALAFFWFFAIWIVGVFVSRTVRDHAL